MSLSDDSLAPSLPDKSSTSTLQRKRPRYCSQEISFFPVKEPQETHHFPHLSPLLVSPSKTTTKDDNGGPLTALLSTRLMLEPCTVSSSKNQKNSYDDGGNGDVYVNDPVTALSLTNPTLAPYTASCSSKNNSKDNYVGVRANAPVSVFSRARRAPAVKGAIDPPFPWATNQRATIHDLEYLVQNNITTITGRVQCKRCLNKFEMELDVVKKLDELLKFIEKKKDSMYDRAPKNWMEPVLPRCEHCGRENCVAPVFAGIKKKAINWLFLLLSQMLGCCTIKQLKYFCKHTKSHRTAAKDRLVYSTCMGLCQQLLPHQRFHS
ncbi:unnamed protein product [Sphenostylis stenocarpa]|uniref:DUF7086 domain-containing protein n=1 Tax=Sphenostylis stenocarpa TaxID=92480 RepID=A0AA86SSC4_9FABA|nr:unnamed protein product [Sphenostylis stenocarpa]